MPKRDPRKVLGREKLDELWSEGYTVTKALPGPDPYEIDPKIVPRDRSYQWVSREHDLAFYKDNAWREVPASRHPGVFAPWGYEGECTIGDLILVEKPKPEVEEFHANAHAKAHQNVTDWMERNRAEGFTGGVTVLHEDSGGRQQVAHTEIEHENISHTELAPELFPYLKDILKERDRLVAEAHKAYLIDEDRIAAGVIVRGDNQPEIFDLLGCRIHCIKQAIETFRAKLKAQLEQEQQS